LNLVALWKLGAIETRIERIEESLDPEDSDASFLDAIVSVSGWRRIH
jgi:hypothetical protein